MRRGISAAALGLLLAVAAAPAYAQTGYPSGQNFGAAGVGQTVSGDLTGLPPGTAVLKFVNGGGGEPGTSNANGVVHFTVQILSQTSGVLGDPKNVTLQCGTNTVSATGGGATSSGSFTLTCPAVTGTPAAAPSSVAFTGANILRWSLAAAALLAIGGLMVWGSRRRRPTLDR
jgi:hypothetical protein